MSFIDKQGLEALLEQKASWSREELAQALARMPLRREKFESDSGIPYPDLVGPEVLDDTDPDAIGQPGRSPPGAPRRRCAGAASVREGFGVYRETAVF